MRTPWLLTLLTGFMPVQAQEEAAESVAGPSLSLSASYTGDFKRNTTGGLRHGSAYADSIDLGLVWVSEGLWPGARTTTSLSVMYLGGGDITGRYVGDLQGVSNLEASNGWKLYESWVEFGFGESSHTLRAGILDLNAEFDTPMSQGIFTASPFGIGTEFSQTGARGPVCWPTTGLGLRLAGAAGPLGWRLGAYDGAPGTDEDDFTSLRLSRDEGALLAGELEYSSERIQKLALGAWSYTARFNRIDAELRPAASPRRGNRGVYAHLDAPLSRGAMTVVGSLRLGRAADEFNAVQDYWGAALVAANFLASRPADSLGLGVARAHLGKSYRDLQSADGQTAGAAETTVELVYRAELTPRFFLLPNLQFVDRPGADPALADAWVAGVRFEFFRERAWPLSAGRQSNQDESYARSASP